MYFKILWDNLFKILKYPLSMQSLSGAPLTRTLLIIVQQKNCKPIRQASFQQVKSVFGRQQVVRFLKGLSSEICLAGNGINRQISLKRTGAEIFQLFFTVHSQVRGSLSFSATSYEPLELSRQLPKRRKYSQRRMKEKKKRKKELYARTGTGSWTWTRSRSRTRTPTRTGSRTQTQHGHGHKIGALLPGFHTALQSCSAVWMSGVISQRHSQRRYELVAPIPTEK